MDVLRCANKLEGILREYLGCHYTEFGVKANGDLDHTDWQSPINFALGCRYQESGRDPQVKKEILDFLGNQLWGPNMGDIITRYDYYNFASVEEAYQYLEKTIDELRRILGVRRGGLD